jgi:CubicO group peptidase (beta-lactamase class C family)
VTLAAPGFEAVAEEFERTRGDRAAAFAVSLDGEPVLDLWSGDAAADTLYLIFSGTKGLVAACMALLVDRGTIDLDAPVARYWPEFDKPGVRVSHVVSHTAGLPGLRRGVDAADLLDGRRLAAELAVEPAFWPPGERIAYHAFSYGVLCDELIRRVDGRSAGVFFADEFAAPLGLELWIGLPPELEPRVAHLRRAPDFAPTLVGDAPAALLPVLYGSLPEEFPWNEPAFHQTEIPAANAIGTARSIARFYASLPPGVVALGRRELSRGSCAVTRRPYAFSVGFELPTELGTLGPPEDAFGHSGSGGSAHGCWPGARVGFSYATSELRPEAQDDRARRLLGALAQALRERSSVDQKSSPVSMYRREPAG